jgi:NAD(P)-dependent dehydrogenase (short-subunit alcohol dehydrogenase family)
MATNKDPVVVITGAGSGIGRATACLFAEQDYSVALIGRTLKKLQATAGLLKNSSRHLIVQCDISDPTQVTQSFELILQKFQRMDILVNNAGVGVHKTATERVTYEQWMSSVNTNITGTFLCSQQAIQAMKQQTPAGGRIINIGSLAAHAPKPNSATYTMAKHAITGLTKSIAVDGREFDIVASQIDLGTTDTELTQHLTEPKLTAQQVAQAVLNIANLPLESNVLFMTLMPSSAPFVGRG